MSVEERFIIKWESAGGWEYFVKDDGGYEADEWVVSSPNRSEAKRLTRRMAKETVRNLVDDKKRLRIKPFGVPEVAPQVSGWQTYNIKPIIEEIEDANT